MVKDMGKSEGTSICGSGAQKLVPGQAHDVSLEGSRVEGSGELDPDERCSALTWRWDKRCTLNGVMLLFDEFEFY